VRSAIADRGPCSATHLAGAKLAMSSPQQVAVRLRLLREEQLEVIRRAAGLVQIELNTGGDMMNRVLRIWADLTYVFDDLP
jgi:hypothetical protein